MTHIQTVPREKADRTLEQVYAGLESGFGMVPGIFQAMSLRPDLLEALVTFVRRLMIEDHGLSRACKELLAAHVSSLNACAY
jgi:alkylhydroperoxidase family enzyme